MKIYDIIAPQPQLNEFSLNPTTWFGGSEVKDAAKAGANAKAAKAGLDAAKKVPGASKDMIAAFEAITNDANTAARAASRASMLAKIGRWSIALKLLSSIEVCFELWYHLDQLEKLYFKGKENGGLDQNQFAEKRKAFIGLWEIQFFVPWFASMLLNSKWVLTIGRILLGILTLGTGIIDGPAAIAGIVIEGAAFLALQQFLASKWFEQWLVDHWFSELVSLGTIPDESWNILRKYISEIPVLNTFMKNKGMTYYDSEREEKKKVNPAGVAADDLSAVSTYDDPRKNKNAVIINGINIVQPDGTLDDYALMRPGVQTFIKLNPQDPAVLKIPSIPRGANSIY